MRVRDWLRGPPVRPTFEERAAAQDLLTRAEEQARQRAFRRKDELYEEARETIRFRMWSRLSFWQRLRTPLEKFPVSEREIWAVVLEWQKIDSAWMEHVDDEQFFARLAGLYAAGAGTADLREQRRRDVTGDVSDRSKPVIDDELAVVYDVLGVFGQGRKVT